MNQAQNDSIGVALDVIEVVFSEASNLAASLADFAKSDLKRQAKAAAAVEKAFASSPTSADALEGFQEEVLVTEEEIALLLKAAKLLSAIDKQSYRAYRKLDKVLGREMKAEEKAEQA